MIPVYARAQTTTTNTETGHDVGTIRIAFKRSPNVWQIGATTKRAGQPAISNIALDTRNYKFVGSLKEAANV